MLAHRRLIAQIAKQRARRRFRRDQMSSLSSEDMRTSHAFGWLAATAKLAAFMALTLPLMPVQVVLLRTWRNGARRFPNWYHRRVCRLLGIRVHVEGKLAGE